MAEVAKVCPQDLPAVDAVKAKPVRPWTSLFMWALLLPELALKAHCWYLTHYSSGVSGKIVDLDLGIGTVKLQWDYSLNLTNSLSFWAPSFQKSLGYYGPKVLTLLGSVFAFCFVTFAARKVHTTSGRYSLVFLVAGALGNLADRVTVGGVIDYFHIQITGLIRASFFWNIADLYIDIAIILLFIAILVQGDLADSFEEQQVDTSDKGDAKKDLVEAEKSDNTDKSD